MNAPKTPPIVLTERDDNAIDKLIDDASYGPLYLVSVDVSRKAGGANLASKLRLGIQCPLVRVKSVAQALAEHVTGGGQLKVDVYYDAGGGNRKRLMTPWWESFTDPPRMGKPWDDLTLVWDDTGGEDGNGAWTSGPRPGTGAPRASEQSQSVGGGGFGFGPVTPGARPPEFPVPVRGLGGMLMPPPANLMPASMRAYTPEQQWQILAGNYEHQTGRRPNLEPVDIMSSWKNEKVAEVGDIRATNARLEERNEALRDRSSAALDAATKKIVDLEKKVTDAENKRERDLERAEAKAREEKRDLEMQQLRESIKAPRAEPATKGGGGMLGGMDPAVLTAGINAFVSLQNASAERQQNMMLALMKPQTAAPAPSFMDQIGPLAVAVAPIITPMILQYMTNKDPEKLDALETERSLRQMQFASMMMEQIKSMVPQEEAPPIWLAPIMGLIDGMMGAAKTAAIGAGMRGLPALPPVQQPQPQQEERRVVDARVEQRPSAPRQPVIEQAEEVRSDAHPIHVPPVDLEMMLDGLAATDADAANITRMMLRQISDRKLDPRVLTPEWTAIFFEIHYRPAGLSEEEERDRIMRLVGSIVDHLEHCRAYRLLPSDLEHVFENPESLAPMLGLMPAFIMDRAYGGMLFTECVDEIKLRERERLAAERGEADIESGETELDGDDEEEEDEDEATEEVVEKNDKTAGGSR